MRLLQEFIEQTEFVHHLESGRMNGVAAKIAQKIPVFFQNEHRTPARASRKPSIIPAGPPPTTTQRTLGLSTMFIVDLPGFDLGPTEKSWLSARFISHSYRGFWKNQRD